MFFLQNLNFEKLSTVMTTSQKRFLILLSVMLIIGMGMEALSLTSLIPVISSIISDGNPFLLFNSDFLNSFYEKNSKLKIVYLCFAILFSLYFIKTIFLIILTYFQNKFISNLQASLSNNLFKIYVNQSYDFHLKNNSTKMVKNFQVEILHFIAYLRGLLNSTIEIFLAISILLTLLYIEPYPAILIGTSFIILSLILLKFTKKRISKYANSREKLDSLISKLAIESLSGIKDLKINNASNFFINKFEMNQFSRAKISTYYNTINNTPRFFFELIAVFGIIILILLKLVLLEESKDLISSVGIFVAATFRMMPSINRIVSGIQSINYYKNSLEIIHNLLNLDRKKELLSELNQIEFRKKIELNEISFFYRNKNQLIFDKINLQIGQGSLVGVIGESGSGKSTFVDILTGLLSPKNGSIKIDEKLLSSNNAVGWRNLIGYVPQKVFLSDDTIVKNIAFGVTKENLDHNNLSKSIYDSELSNLISNLSEGVNSLVGEGGAKLSGGQIQRIGIARALYRNPRLLILDESTASLDQETEKKFFKTIQKLKKKMTVVIISHNIQNLSICDKIYRIHNKKMTLKQL